MQHYNVGDFVRLVTECPENNEELHVGQEGIIRKCSHLIKVRYAVEWFDFTNGHSCGGACPERTGWFVNGADLELAFYDDLESAEEYSPDELSDFLAR